MHMHITQNSLQSSVIASRLFWLLLAEAWFPSGAWHSILTIIIILQAGDCSDVAVCNKYHSGTYTSRCIFLRVNLSFLMSVKSTIKFMAIMDRPSRVILVVEAKAKMTLYTISVTHLYILQANHQIQWLNHPQQTSDYKKKKHYNPWQHLDCNIISK